MPALPSIIMNLDMDAGDVPSGAASDGIFGQLLLLGVGRVIWPLLMSPIMHRIMSLWL